MKNYIIYLLLIMLVFSGLTSCDDDTSAGLTSITYYPSIELLGDEEVYAAIGADYVDAGVYAELDGVDVTEDVVTVSTVDTSVGGVYSVTYAITNEDGFSASTSRTVYVYDSTPSIISTGIYTTQTGTERYWYSSEAIVSFSGYEILILQTEPGVFYISDFMGGYYDQYAGYGDSYAMTGYFQLNDDNTLSAISSYVSGWGDSMDYLSDGSVDETSGEITYKLGYASLMEYTIILDN
jgi:hypothetical protein